MYAAAVHSAKAGLCLGPRRMQKTRTILGEIYQIKSSSKVITRTCNMTSESLLEQMWIGVGAGRPNTGYKSRSVTWTSRILGEISLSCRYP